MNKKQIINIIYEGAVVKRMLRTGWQILGDNHESVGEHMYMTSLIAYYLTKFINETDLNLKINMETVLLMSIFHDFIESRTGDVDKIALGYVKRNQKKAIQDVFGGIDPEILKITTDYEDRMSLESKIVYEANILALLVELKAIIEKGNVNATEWFVENMKRLRFKESKELALQIQKTNTQSWWSNIRLKLAKDFAK